MMTRRQVLGILSLALVGEVTLRGGERSFSQPEATTVTLIIDGMT